MFVPVLYPYTYYNKQARTVFYEFKMGNKPEVLGFKGKLWVSGSEASSRECNRGLRVETPVFGDFCNFLIKIRILRHI